MPVGFGKWAVGKALKEGPKVIKAIKPFAKTGAKKISEWKNKASAARIKAVSTDIKALAHKTASTMGRLGSKEKRIKWYQKAANKKRYSDDFYKGKK